MILHVFSSWVCDLLDIMKINVSKLVKLVLLYIYAVVHKKELNLSNPWTYVICYITGLYIKERVHCHTGTNASNIWWLLEDDLGTECGHCSHANQTCWERKSKFLLDDHFTFLNEYLTSTIKDQFLWPLVWKYCIYLCVFDIYIFKLSVIKSFGYRSIFFECI